jgi:hypothetical protein
MVQFHDGTNLTSIMVGWRDSGGGGEGVSKNFGMQVLKFCVIFLNFLKVMLKQYLTLSQDPFLPQYLHFITHLA